jgi:hypothetical protein
VYFRVISVRWAGKQLEVKLCDIWMGADRARLPWVSTVSYDNAVDQRVQGADVLYCRAESKMQSLELRNGCDGPKVPETIGGLWKARRPMTKAVRAQPQPCGE